MAARSQDQLFLVVRAPNGDVREVEIGRETLVIGRDESADIRVDDRKVSRRHAAFKIIDGEAWVEDLGSSNGVRLNDNKIDKRARVGPTDEVRVGGFKMFLKRLGTEDADRPSTAAFGTAAAVSTADEGASITGRVSGTRPRAMDRSPLGDMLPRLIGLDGPTKDREFILQRGENIIGRLEECDVPILDGSVSRQHARVVFARDRVRVTDLGSSNGLFVNDLRVDMAELAEGDTLRVGNVAFAVRLPPELAAGSAAPLLTRARARRVAKDQRWLTMGVTGLLLAVLVLAAAFAIQVRKNRGRDAWWSSLFPGNETPVVSAPPSSPDGEIPTIGGPGRSGSTSEAQRAEVPVSPSGPSAGEPGLTRPSAGEPGLTTEPGLAALAPEQALAAPPAQAAVTTPPQQALTAPPSEAALAAAAQAGATAQAMAAASGDAPIELVATATSPYSRRTVDGLPINLPTVDPAFDFEGFLATTLEEASACEKGGDYRCVRERLGELLNRDPINSEARSLLGRVEQIEASEAAMAAADRYVARGDNAAALRALAEAPSDGPRAEVVKKRADELKERAINEELTVAAREAKRRKSWKRAHRRYKYVLNLDPKSMVALEGLRELEQRMRRRKMAFAAYEPPSARKARAETDEDALRRQFGGDDRLVQIANTYARGALREAASKAKRVARRGRGSRAVTAKAMSAAINEVRKRYKRTKTEISNDPDQAWAMLIDLDRYERRILPRGTKSFVVRELEVSLSEAFADRGSALFDRGRYEDAFQRWESGFKLDPTNPKVLAGLKRLEEQADKQAQDAQLAGQRGDADVCDRWKGITRMTRSESDIHRRARQSAIATCR